MVKSFESFQDALDSGCIITEYHKHQENPNFTVHVKRADGTTHAYTNISPEHLKSGLGSEKKELEQTWESPYKPGSKKKLVGPSFQDCIYFKFIIGVEKGGKITDFHKTAKGTFAVHIETDDGVRHSFSSVSDKHLSRVPGFNAVEE
jgi:hypothetical protein